MTNILTSTTTLMSLVTKELKEELLKKQFCLHCTSALLYLTRLKEISQLKFYRKEYWVQKFPLQELYLMEFSPKFWLEISPRKSPRNWKRKFPQRNSPRSRKRKFPRRNSLYRKRPRSIFPRNFDCKTWGKRKKKNLHWEGLELTVPGELLILL